MVSKFRYICRVCLKPTNSKNQICLGCRKFAFSRNLPIQRLIKIPRKNRDITFIKV